MRCNRTARWQKLFCLQPDVCEMKHIATHILIVDDEVLTRLSLIEYFRDTNLSIVNKPVFGMYIFDDLIDALLTCSAPSTGAQETP